MASGTAQWRAKLMMFGRVSVAEAGVGAKPWSGIVWHRFRTGLLHESQSSLFTRAGEDDPGRW
jgi:hypothetical protein